MRLWPSWGLWFLGLGLVALPIDGWVSRTAATIHLRGDIEGTLAVGELFGNGIGAIFVLLAVAALDDRRIVVRLACCAFLPGLFASLLKVFVVRVRPIYLEEATLSSLVCGFVDPAAFQIPGEGYPVQSFPSGHTATAVGLAIGLAWRYPQATWLFISMAVLTAAERVMHRAHYVSDTLLSTSIAMLISGGFVRPTITGWIFDGIEERLKVSQQRREQPSTSGAFATEAMDSDNR